MSISFSRALGNSVQAIDLRLQRAEILSSNLANTDTPHFQAKDIDFSAEMQRQHTEMTSQPAQVLYRVPQQIGADGNTVELHTEQAAFANNSQSFQVSLSFLSMQLASMQKAIEGKS
ncbi:flagellar basal body rod protein FlgB [Rosenbergiella nectarea]|uniref:Flagellar basal body rod protein FlgB n=1 Tax=Rosenbergiella nectarea TaxID=988801 RepID=A0A1H9JYW2_9GAMM|nr:flagellar basal body rod protein FlgB [Rosenbergiella nectarea]MBT0730505.1 flagellar basal body rod protein FlgB [Rosenbergiella nectarea subsp. apis]SEQ91984.1 flagellar basal-body rod protein FlgB [Rosenbergiella nectarea]